uniref:Protein kinase domain-containing protein n=1 Tax=Parascaris univalens TaxID=6257 RepID=A0A915C2I5_PARUN
YSHLTLFAEMTTSEEDDDLGIKEGSIIESSHTKYAVIKMLGEGGFGAVYLVEDASNSSLKYALKVERKLETRRDSKLKMEIAILKLVSSERADKSHFTKIIDRGKKEKYFFLVMQLVGKSLADLKATRPHKVFTMATGIGASIQCLEAVEDLHKHGFIHRDLKPANYAIGLGEQVRVVSNKFFVDAYCRLEVRSKINATTARFPQRGDKVEEGEGMFAGIVD